MPSTSTKQHSTASPTPTSGLFVPDPNSKNSAKTTTIIVAVLATVSAIVLVIFLVRSFRHWMQKRAVVVPLPPIQPIAHHREHQLAQFEERKFAPPSPSSRPGSWAMQQLSAQDRIGGSGSMSDASLIPSEQHHRTQSNNNTINSSTPSPNISLLNQPALGLGDENPLPHPAPAFHGTGNPRDSNSSFGSIPERSSNTPSPLPFPDTPPPSSQSHTSTHPLISSNSTSSRQMRPRPTSMISNTSRASRKSQAGTAATAIRGAPHGPHSSVQIVLPTPLAPALSPYGRGGDGEWFYGEGMGRDAREGSVRSDSRLSIADKWAGMPIGRSERDERGRNDFGRIYGNADPRDSISTARTFSTISSTHAPSPSQTFFRSLPPSSFRDHSLTPPPQSQTPPVPRIPSAYNTNPNQLDEARGRPTSLSIDQTRPYSRSDSNSISLPRTRN
ncbi:hypothetical protein PILCRDRAFT_6210 [Piloderma croceum F 1598]|uniref:Uncharacterized protein n=1 Tax=Piloderma croceum (strain F 1598) TaxID=765440 RepID=A0A0C3G1G1_PILCF|nr:hypothetical protein PILCRDRAFT_6210 [Piloderma croceum F 1598]